MVIASIIISAVAALAAVGSAIFAYVEHHKKAQQSNEQYHIDMAIVKADLQYIKDAIAGIQAELKVENGAIGEHEVRITRLEEKVND